MRGNWMEFSSRMNIPTTSKGSACWRANMAHLFTAQKETLEEIQDSKSLGEIPEDLMHPITPDVDFMAGRSEVKPFRIDHDAANLLPTGFRMKKIGGGGDGYGALFPVHH